MSDTKQLLIVPVAGAASSGQDPYAGLPHWQPVVKLRRDRAEAAAGLARPSKTYRGGCHCGALSFDVTLSPPLEDGHTVIDCNCSLCRRLGYLLVYPTRDNVRWTSKGGQANAKRVGSYQFNLKVQDRLFCRHCGVSVMIDFLQRFHPDFDGYGVNVRALHGVDLDKLTIGKTDGAGLVPPAGDTAGQWFDESWEEDDEGKGDKEKKE